MSMTEALLEKRLAGTPEMEPCDGVKLLYQSRFGYGHLLPPDVQLAERIQAEADELPENAALPPFTFIGNGLCRMNLAAPAVRALPPERLARMMTLTAEDVPPMQPGDERLPGFEHDLSLLRAAVLAGRTRFSAAALDGYLAEYRAAGYPPASHSPRYRAAYRPAYRVVSSDFAVLLPLIAAIEDRIAQGKPALAVLDGPCGSGKTTLAEKLSRLYGAPVVHMDEFFLPPELRTPERLNQPGGNIHYERFLSEVLPGLIAGRAFSYGSFDCHHGVTRPAFVPESPVRIVEGSYALHSRFEQSYRAADALTAFLCVSPAEQLRRIEKRSPALLERFREVWIPLENSYFQAYDIESRAIVRLKSMPWEGDA